MFKIWLESWFAKIQNISVASLRYAITSVDDLPGVEPASPSRSQAVTVPASSSAASPLFICAPPSDVDRTSDTDQSLAKRRSELFRGLAGSAIAYVNSVEEAEEVEVLFPRWTNYITYSCVRAGPQLSAGWPCWTVGPVRYRGIPNGRHSTGATSYGRLAKLPWLTEHRHHWPTDSWLDGSLGLTAEWFNCPLVS